MDEVHQGSKYFSIMKGVIRVFLFGMLIVSQAATAEEVSFEDIVNFHQKTVFLLSNQAKNEAARERNIFIARNLYYLKRQQLEIIEQDIDEMSGQGVVQIDAFLEFLDSNSIRAADLLAFIDLVDNILARHSERPFLNSKQLSKLRILDQQMLMVQDTYQQDLSDLFAAMGTRGFKLESWQDYIAYLNSKYTLDLIHQQFNQSTPKIDQPSSRGKTKKKKNDSLVWGYGIPDKTVVLTFDDGPHHRNTAAILDSLKKYDAKAYFFAVGKNIGKLNDGSVSLHKRSKQLKRAIKEGHILANHSFTHSLLTKLNKTEQQAELSNTNKLLTAITGQEVKDFRPPYGAKNDQLLSVSKENGMRSVMWNIDSMDWGDPIPASIVKRTMKELKRKKKGILLFHDIHKQTVQALPLLLAELKKEGYKVVTIEGKPFSKEVVNKPNKAVSVVAEKSQLYGKSWALIIGVNKYKYWPQLSYAVNDAQGVAEVLQQRFSFDKERIFTLYDEDATRENITEYLAETLSDPEKVKPNDRVFIFYAGHGMTRVLPSGRNLGYIVPVDAALNKFHRKSISMTHLQDFSEMIPAKHVYFVMDSCYSGIALTRGGGMQTGSKYLAEISSRNARQILTAGGADQEVADGGPDGHSIFTWSLIQGLKGDADLDNNKIITATELGAYVAPLVANNSSQTPAFGNLVGSEGGEFLFELAVSEHNKAEMSEEEQLRIKILHLQKENAALKQQLATLHSTYGSQAVARGGNLDVTSLSVIQRRLKANKHHAKGLQLYKNKEYSAALKEINLALKYNPSNITMVNDYGFILYRAGQFESALHWLEKTIELAPERKSAYLNIADTLVELQRPKDAIPYYQYYLKVYPSSPLKSRIDEFLQEHSI